PTAASPRSLKTAAPAGSCPPATPPPCATAWPGCAPTPPKPQPPAAPPARASRPTSPGRPSPGAASPPTPKPSPPAPKQPPNNESLGVSLRARARHSAQALLLARHCNVVYDEISYAAFGRDQSQTEMTAKLGIQEGHTIRPEATAYAGARRRRRPAHVEIKIANHARLVSHTSPKEYRQCGRQLAHRGAVADQSATGVVDRCIDAGINARSRGTGAGGDLHPLDLAHQLELVNHLCLNLFMHFKL